MFVVNWDTRAAAPVYNVSAARQSLSKGETASLAGTDEAAVLVEATVLQDGLPGGWGETGLASAGRCVAAWFGRT